MALVWHITVLGEHQALLARGYRSANAHDSYQARQPLDAGVTVLLHGERGGVDVSWDTETAQRVEADSVAHE